jgi:hypothetical protein
MSIPAQLILEGVLEINLIFTTTVRVRDVLDYFNRYAESIKPAGNPAIILE